MKAWPFLSIVVGVSLGLILLALMLCAVYYVWDLLIGEFLEILGSDSLYALIFGVVVFAPILIGGFLYSLFYIGKNFSREVDASWQRGVYPHKIFIPKRYDSTYGSSATLEDREVDAFSEYPKNEPNLWDETQLDERMFSWVALRGLPLIGVVIRFIIGLGRRGRRRRRR